MTPEDWASSIENNLTQVFLLFQAVSRQMIVQGAGGSLVALASVDGTVAAAYRAPYGAAKAGMISLAKTFAYELGRHGIRVNIVAPGNVGGGNDDQPEGIIGGPTSTIRARTPSCDRYSERGHLLVV